MHCGIDLELIDTSFKSTACFLIVLVIMLSIYSVRPCFSIASRATILSFATLFHGLEIFILDSLPHPIYCSRKQDREGIFLRLQADSQLLAQRDPSQTKDLLFMQPRAIQKIRLDLLC